MAKRVGSGFARGDVCVCALVSLAYRHLPRGERARLALEKTQKKTARKKQLGVQWHATTM